MGRLFLLPSAGSRPAPWTYDELARRTGLARRTLIEIEQGRTIGSLKTWHALAHALDVSVDHLFATLCEGHEPPAEPAE